jgi:hypothetical protein
MQGGDPAPAAGSALASVLRGSAVPYGYTLTVLAAHSILSNHNGPPDVFDIGLFVVGALVGFAVLGLVARARSVRAPSPSQGELIRAGMSHVFAIGAAFGGVTLVALIGGRISWIAGALVATLLYLAITTVEITIAEEEGVA